MPTSPTNPSTSSDTGRADVKKMGHTAQKNYGSEPNVKVKGGHNVRELGVKTTKS